MSYQTRAYERTNNDGFPPDPVVVLVAEGTHDVSRLVAALRNGTCEQGDVGRRINRALTRHNSGRAALALIARHGGPDLLEATDATDALIRSLAGFVDAQHEFGPSVCEPEPGVDCVAGCEACEVLAGAPAELLAQVRAGEEC